MIMLLKYHGIEPLLVFDGASIPAKEAEDQKRRRSRSRAMQEARELLQRNAEAAMQGRPPVASEREILTKCTQSISISNEMVDATIAACRLLHVQFLVAPYEADAQLAYLYRTGIIAAAVSEDSDLLAHGCGTVLFKLDREGNCQHLALSLRSENINSNSSCYRSHCTTNGGTSSTSSTEKIQSSRSSTSSHTWRNGSGNSSTNSKTAGPKAAGGISTAAETSAASLQNSAEPEDVGLLACLRDFSQQMFTAMCVLGGCDYTHDVHVSGLGVATACRLIHRLETVERVINHLYRDAKWRAKITQPKEKVLRGHAVALLAFTHHRVYDVRTRAVVDAGAATTAAGENCTHLLLSAGGVVYTVRGEPCSSSTTRGITPSTDSADYVVKQQSGGKQHVQQQQQVFSNKNNTSGSQCSSVDDEIINEASDTRGLTTTNTTNTPAAPTPTTTIPTTTTAASAVETMVMGKEGQEGSNRDQSKQGEQKLEPSNQQMHMTEAAETHTYALEVVAEEIVGPLLSDFSPVAEGLIYPRSQEPRLGRLNPKEKQLLEQYRTRALARVRDSHVLAKYAKLRESAEPQKPQQVDQRVRKQPPQSREMQYEQQQQAQSKNHRLSSQAEGPEGLRKFQSEEMTSSTSSGPTSNDAAREEAAMVAAIDRFTASTQTPSHGREQTLATLRAPSVSVTASSLHRKLEERNSVVCGTTSDLKEVCGVATASDSVAAADDDNVASGEQPCAAVRRRVTVTSTTNDGGYAENGPPRSAESAADRKRTLQRSCSGSRQTRRRKLVLIKSDDKKSGQSRLAFASTLGDENKKTYSSHSQNEKGPCGPVATSLPHASAHSEACEQTDPQPGTAKSGIQEQMDVKPSQSAYFPAHCSQNDTVAHIFEEPVSPPSLVDFAYQPGAQRAARKATQVERSATDDVDLFNHSLLQHHGVGLEKCAKNTLPNARERVEYNGATAPTFPAALHVLIDSPALSCERTSGKISLDTEYTPAVAHMPVTPATSSAEKSTDCRGTPVASVLLALHHKGGGAQQRYLGKVRLEKNDSRSRLFHTFRKAGEKQSKWSLGYSSSLSKA